MSLALAIDHHDDLLDVERAAALIAGCTDLDAIRGIHSQAKAIEAYRRTTKAALDAQNGAIEIRLRAFRRMGEILKEVIPHNGGRKRSHDATVSLADLSLDKHESSRSQKLASVPAEVFEQHIVSTKARGEKLTEKGAVGAASFAPDYDGDEWYTPAEVIDAARQVMGGIDLDPASNVVAQKVIKATRYLTKEDDGLSQEWGGHVWLNPPFSGTLAAAFVRKLIAEIDAGRVTEAIVLQNNSCADTSWFHELAPRCALCFTRGRIKFYQADGNRPDANRYGQVLIYYGPDVDLFADVFGAFGLVVMPRKGTE
jgi:phage N-6-adenine-methyltransferase